MQPGKRTSYLYQDIAQKFTDQIRRGTLKPGERIPSVRQLTTKTSVSLSTVLQAYHLLEDRGLIEVRPQSGYYVRLRPEDAPDVPPMSNPSPSPTAVDISRLVLDVHEKILNPDAVSLGTAIPSNLLLPTARLNRILRSVARRFAESGSRYAPTSGNADLRRYLARNSIGWGCNFRPDEIVVTNGATEAVNLCLRAITKQGDAVAIESPTYYGLLQILESLNLKAIEVPTDPRDGISIEALASILKSHRVAAVVAQPIFQNPLGCCMTEIRKQGLIELLARHDIPCIEDNAYADLGYDGFNPRFLRAFDKKGMVLTCCSFSKTLSPGFRIGWTAPGRFLDSVRRLKLTTSISTATLPQIAVAEMFANRAYDRFLNRVRRLHKEQMGHMIQAAKRYFPRGTRVTRPSGGMVLWVEFPARVDAMELYKAALSRGITVLPGPLFSPKGQYKNCIRLNCGQPYDERIDRAMITLGRLASGLLE